jgi:nucleoside phosphorylase
MKRRFLLLVVSALAFGVFPVAGAAPSAVSCSPRLLVLAPTPVEIGPLLAQTRVDNIVVIDGRQFFVGKLKGNNVVLVLTGIGLVNAEHTTGVAFDTFGCGGRGITGIVLSGTSGGHTYIGDVTVPARWTRDGKTWSPTDPRMLATAKRVIAKGVPLQQDAPLGDCACIGTDPDAIKPVHMPHAPQILVAGDGRSSDPFNGNPFPCVPQGGDVFGCQPCRAPRIDPNDVARFLTGAAPFADPNFFLGYLQAPPSTPATYDADDMETAAVARVAALKKVPFIAFRSLSDGLGDPLNLPGFPAQFFVYRQYAAENAASVALAFLAAWGAH